MKQFKYEMHFHTKESSPCAKVPAKEGIMLYQNAGYDGIVVTDHFSQSIFKDMKNAKWENICDAFLEGYRSAKEASKKGKLNVLLGMELRFTENENDYLLYGITKDFLYQNPWIYEKTLQEVYELSKKEHFLIIQAHPFRANCVLAPLEYIHGIEVFNANPRHDSKNELAKATADTYNLMALKGTDFHQIDDLSGTFYTFSQSPKDEADLVRQLKIVNK